MKSFFRLRPPFNFNLVNETANKWHMRYMGIPEPTFKCPVIVRKVIDSVMHSVNMMEFIKVLGLRMKYIRITTSSKFRQLLFNFNLVNQTANKSHIRCAVAVNEDRISNVKHLISNVKHPLPGADQFPFRFSIPSCPSFVMIRKGCNKR
ncbi:unnamed protein product, partial [Mesorhabditis belari]|uniref:Mediator of RNA polymerase II transcription subunit 18 n=1 Tax=Mesorhabditis belari TaxID=2138241 RepID=A0AAF3ECX8_9BILA